MILSFGSIIAQDVTVTGHVFDSETKEPLPGAAVVLKGTTKAVAADADGYFSISVAVNASLEFSYLGYEKLTESLNGRTSLSIGLKSNTQMLDEYVVVGYGTQKKVNLTGSVGVVNVDEKMSSRSISNVSSALSGLVPGLTAQQSTGLAGASGAQLLIRGLGTVNNANPLIVVDGMPDVDINRIDMNDISSISVLKDASSSAVYGSRAANGVILITTKTGKGQGKLSVNYTGSFAYSKPTSFYETLENYPKALTMHQRASRAGRVAPSFYDGTIDEWFSMGMIDPIRFPNENQLDWVTRTGYLRSHNLSAAGSGEKHNFYISVGLMDETGFMINNDYNRYNFRSNFDYKIRKDLSVGMRLDGQWTNMSYAYANGFADISVDHLPISVAITGITPYNYETDQFGGVMAYNEANNAVNLYADYSARHNERERQEFNGNVYLEYEPIQGLTARIDFGLRYYNQFQKGYMSPTGMQLYNFQTEQAVQTFIPASSGISNQTWQGHKMLTQFKLQYQKEIFKGHDFSIMGAVNEEYWFDRNFSASRNDRIHTNITEINGALTTTQTTSGSSEAEGLRSFLGRVNYAMYGKYLFEFNFRVDGSSKFLPGHQYGFFPSGSVGWRFTEENFFQPLKKYLYSGKLRLSYGSLGNNSGVGRYEQKDTFVTTPYALNGNTLVQGFSVTKMINKDFTWEKTTVANIGLDLGFFDNRLTAEIDYYDRLTSGMIRPSQLSAMLSGYSAPRVNMGDLRNRGIELNLRWTSSISKFNYGAIFNFSFNKDRLESWNEERSPSKIFIDMPYYFNYAMISTGIAQSWEDIYNAPYHGNSNISPGDLLYEDLNGDGQITGADKKAYPNINEHRPTANYGLTLFAEWKGIDVNVLFQGATGRKNYWLEKMNTVNIEDKRYAFQDLHWYNTWTLDNRNAELPRMVSSNAGSNLNESTFWLQNMDYLRLKNIQIGYNLPKKILNKLTIDKCRIFVSAENLFTMTAWDGVDPEKARHEGQPVKDDPFPIMKNMSFGINVGF